MVKSPIEFQDFLGKSNLPDLSRLCLINADGVDYVRLPESFPIPYGQASAHQLHPGAIALNEAAEILNLRTLNGSFEETSEDSVHGTAWVTTVSTHAANDDAAHRYAVEQLVGRKWLVVAIDNDGKMRLVGTKKQPCRVSVKFSTSGKKGRVVSFSAKTKRQAYFLANYNMEEWFAEFSDEFSVDFSTSEERLYPVEFSQEFSNDFRQNETTNF